MKALVFDRQWSFSTKYVNHTYSNGTVVTYIAGFEMKLLSIVLQQMNMTFIHVTSPENFENKLVSSLILKKYYIIVGNVGNHFLLNTYLSSTNSYSVMRFLWYVPCFDKYPRWSSMFRILSVELWLVLAISIVIAAVLSTLFARYSCTSEWQGYKTLSSSLTNLWVVILGVSVPTLPRTPSLRSLFLAWVGFSLAFNTVFQAYLTTFLTESGYKLPIRNLDELLASDIGLVYPQNFIHTIEKRDGTESLKFQSKHVNCPSFEVCVAWANYHKNVSIILIDKFAEECYAVGDFVGENSKPFLCKLDDDVFFSFGQSMLMLHGDPLMGRVNKIIGRVVEAGLHKFWESLRMDLYKIYSRKIALVHPLDGYYSFNLYHMQPAFYLLLMGWCLSALSFTFEVLYNYLLSKGN